jgi:hypothetical protein
MLTIKSKQQSPRIESYFDPHVIRVKANVAPILVYDDTYIEPFTYIDGGFYDANGTPVDALYYNTIKWDVTWNGGYP